MKLAVADIVNIPILIPPPDKGPLTCQKRRISKIGPFEFHPCYSACHMYIESRKKKFTPVLLLKIANHQARVLFLILNQT